MSWASHSGSRARDRGSVAIEAAIGMPAFMLFVGLIIFAGRVAIAHQAVAAAATEAARSAAIARSSSAAISDGSAAGAASLANQQLHCTSSSISVDPQGFNVPVGTPAQVKATVQCSVDLSDLALPGVPGTLTITETMTIPLYTYRSRS